MEKLTQILQNLENGIISSNEAKAQVFDLFVTKTGKAMKELSRETWIALQGDDHGWKEWWSERNPINLNKGKEEPHTAS